MVFNNYDKKNDLSILLSDYTINSGLYFAQQSGFVRYKLQNDSSNPLPMTVDTQGLSQLMPELGPYFDQNYPVSLDFSIDPIDNDQPRLTSSMSGTKLNLNCTLDFNVINGTAMDDPFNAAKVFLEIEVLLQLVSKGDFLTIQIAYTSVPKIQVRSQIGNIQTERVRKIFDSLIFIVAKQVSDQIKDINIEQYAIDFLGLKADNFDINYDSKYIQISINLLKP